MSSFNFYLQQVNLKHQYYLISPNRKASFLLFGPDLIFVLSILNMGNVQ